MHVGSSPLLEAGWSPRTGDPLLFAAGPGVVLPMVSRGALSDAGSMRDHEQQDEAESPERPHRRSVFNLAWYVGLIALAVSALAGCAEGTATDTGDSSSGPADPVWSVDDESSAPQPASTETIPVNEVEGDGSPGGDAGEGSESGAIEIGASFEDTCTIAWPTAPSRGSQGTQIRTTCRGVDAGQYQFVDILVLDPDLEVTPSNSTLRVRGEVIDMVESDMGFTTLAVIADEAEID